jgi:hypothetical protein
MSHDALRSYHDAREGQLLRNEARHILTKVNEARGRPHAAATRWPFELLQNALDAGPRAGRTSVTVTLRQEPGRVVFEHDAAPFSSSELAALLSGGSSKDYESEETTGRFGTGFLVTHVLAEQTLLEGLLEVGDGLERFKLTLDRSGDEDAILANIELCSAAIEQAEVVADPERVPSARFEYVVEDEGLLGEGVEEFRRVLPYLYGTRPRLGEVRIVDETGRTEIWSAGSRTEEHENGVDITERLITVSDEQAPRTYRILRFSLTDSPMAAALILLRPRGDDWELVLAREHDPKVFRQYPLRGSTFLPIGFVLDGQFEPDQERNEVLMKDTDRDALIAGLDAAVHAVDHCCGRGWHDAHLLARASAVTTAFRPNDESEKAWWNQTLGTFAERVAHLVIVETTEGLQPASPDSDTSYADFIVARLLADTGNDETTVSRVWPLLSGTTELYPPIEAIAEDWSTTAEGWATLGVETARRTVADLAGFVREGAAVIDELAVHGDPNEWLARYLDVIGECWERRSGVDPSMLSKLLPDQEGVLRSPTELRRDLSVPEELKEICEHVELPVRQGLLSTELTATVAALEMVNAATALEQAIVSAADAPRVCEELVAHLRDRLAADAQCPTDGEYLKRGTAELLGHLWRTLGKEATEVARRVPLVATSGKIAHWSADGMMMAPVSAWHEAARPFHAAYPEDRVLDELYSTVSADLVQALETWGMAYADPIVSSTPRELASPRLSAMVVDGTDTTGVTVRSETFSQIALLPRDLMHHVQDGAEAKALLGLVLCHVAGNDEGWREQRTVRGSRDRQDVELTVRGALWLGDLLSRAWVPVRGEDEKPARAGAEVVTLTPLLDPEWLRDNDDAIQLLTECFGFDELDLRLLGIDAEAQASVRQGLAKVLEVGGGEPEFYESLARELEARQQRGRDINRFRRMGLSVQAAVGRIIEAHGLTVELVDRGFDFKVTLPDVLEAASYRFEVGGHLVEVKTTSLGPVGLTPLQARTAADHVANYALCVVDLRGVPDERLDEDWQPEEVTPLAKILANIGGRVTDTCSLIDRARESDVAIRNDAALRYEVTPDTWTEGVSIEEWVLAITTVPDPGSADSGA